MSKTNHHRGFKAVRFKDGQKKRGFIVGHYKRETIDGHAVNAYATCASENSHGIAHDKAGAKKFVHSRGRRHDRDTLILIKRNGGDINAD